MEKCAEETLAAVAKNRALIVLPARGRIAWRLGRLFPGLVERVCASAVAAERRSRAAPRAAPALVDPDEAMPARDAPN